MAIAEKLDLGEYAERGDEALRGIVYRAGLIRAQLGSLPEGMIATEAQTREYTMQMRALPVGGLLPEIPHDAAPAADIPQAETPSTPGNGSILMAGVGKVLDHLGLHLS